MMGARRFIQQVLWSPLIGAMLLWLTDQTVLISSNLDREWIPTGAATALAGAPLLLWLTARTHMRREPPRMKSWRGAADRRWLPLAAGIAVALLFAIVVSLSFGIGVDGWRWSDPAQTMELSPWRGPRLFGAMAAGAMLAASGTLMQRLTGNAMASPEVLGVGSGAALGMIALAICVPHASSLANLAAAAGGAGLVLAIMAATSRSSAFDPERLLLVGIAVAALLNVAAAAVMATGNPNAAALRIWLAGSTQLVMRDQAVLACILAVVLIAVGLLARRWLEILPLGGDTGWALGLSPAKARLSIVGLAALLTAAAILIVGPLGFVGLMGPHIARMAGLRRAGEQLIGAAVAGGLIMVLADWFGRNLLFPYQLPAGLLATFVGGPYFVWLMRRDAR
jgi:ABC-type Fe3+-siderophore transport system permease subunit